MGIFKYTPDQWRKYTTKEERDAISAAERPLASVLTNAKDMAPTLLIGGAAVPPISLPAYLLAAATPTWSIKEVKEWAVNPATKNKLKWVPGYFNYTLGKVLGAQLGVQRRVEQQALNENNNNKEQ